MGGNKAPAIEISAENADPWRARRRFQAMKPTFLETVLLGAVIGLMGGSLMVMGLRIGAGPNMLAAGALVLLIGLALSAVGLVRWAIARLRR